MSSQTIRKKCKTICRRGCPFYLWVTPMIKDRNTIQIKIGCLNHECAIDHKNNHVNASWVAHHYLEQFRTDPSWKIYGVIQAVRTNQQVEISRLTAYRTKGIAMR